MIYLNRSTDALNDTVWVAAECKDSRNHMLYLGKDVNGAINAAVAAGLPRTEAVAMARAALDRDQPNDTIAPPPPTPSKNGLLVHQE